MGRDNIVVGDVVSYEAYEVKYLCFVLDVDESSGTETYRCIAISTDDEVYARSRFWLGRYQVKKVLSTGLTVESINVILDLVEAKQRLYRNVIIEPGNNIPDPIMANMNIVTLALSQLFKAMGLGVHDYRLEQGIGVGMIYNGYKTEN